MTGPNIHRNIHRFFFKTTERDKRLYETVDT